VITNFEKQVGNFYLNEETLAEVFGDQNLTRDALLGCSNS
jgi:hypothetical protein